MSSTVIRAEGLGKQYRVGERERYLALRDVLMRAVRSPLNFFRPARSELMWALRDVSLQVEHGEVIGIIGRNGSGKTTLLKILSRITRPTSGSAEVYGSVRTLLEVGTGFHPELTGRENMYLSGAILGMSRREIQRKFDTIVAFSGVERFIDTPLKHYSTGMQMRLAFAVAAHLEPDILLVDEVLAVGDLEFQKKMPRENGRGIRQRTHDSFCEPPDESDPASLQARSLARRGRDLQERSDGRDPRRVRSRAQLRTAEPESAVSRNPNEGEICPLAD